MTGRRDFILAACGVAALLLAGPWVRAGDAGDEERCRAKGWDYSHTEVKGDKRIVHCKKLKAARDRGQSGQAQQEPPSDQDKPARSAPERDAALAAGGRSAGTSDSWEAFELALRFPEGTPPSDPMPAIPIAGALAAAAGAAWVWAKKNRRAIAGTLIAIVAVCAIVVLLKSPPPPLVAVASRLGLAGWIAGPTGVVTSDNRILAMEDHALQRAAERLITLDEIRLAARMPSFPYVHQGVLKIGYWNPATRVFIGTYNKVVTTVIGNVKPQYIANLKSTAP